ncbi:PAS domain S-box protein, partial [Synechocystis salina LEGE 06155]|nr:PAS domain S-box protein [Synechocystis salina LEGE 06155]
MRQTRRLGLLIIQVATLALVTFSAGIWLAYRIGLHNQQRQLEAIANYKVALISTLLKSQDRKEVINILQRSYLNTNPLIGNNQILIGQGRHQSLTCLVFYSLQTQTCPNFLDNPVQWNAPLRQALQKNSGTMIGLDQRGRNVIAAYQYIPEVDWGITVQTDLQQFQAPFWQLAWTFWVIVIIIESVGIILFFRLNQFFILKNITSYKSTKKGKLTLMERNQLLINVLGEIVYCHNLETDEIQWQGDYQSLLGYDAKSMGNNGKIRRERIHPEDCSKVEEEMKNAWQQRRLFELEYRFKKMDGGYIWFYDWGIIRELNHQPWEISGVMLNITRRKILEQQRSQLEKNYKQFVDNTAEGIWIIDMEGKTTFVNQTMADNLGYSCEEIDGKSFLDFMRPEDAQLAREKLNSRLQGRKEVHDFCFLHKNGSEVWFLIATDPMRDEHGNITGALGMFTNITEKKKMEIDLVFTNQKLTETVEKLQRVNSSYSLLNKLNDFLQSCKTKEEAYKIIPKFLQQIFCQTNGAIFEINSEEDSLGLVLSWGTPNSMDYFYRGDCWALRRNTTHHYIFDTPESIPCLHLGQDPNCKETLCLPLVLEGNQGGLLFFCSAVPNTFDDINQQLAKAIAESIALTLGNLKLKEVLTSASVKDPLTGLYNRRYWESALKQEIYKAT